MTTSIIARKCLRDWHSLAASHHPLGRLSARRFHSKRSTQHKKEIKARCPADRFSFAKREEPHTSCSRSIAVVSNVVFRQVWKRENACPFCWGGLPQVACGLSSLECRRRARSVESRRRFVPPWISYVSAGRLLGSCGLKRVIQCSVCGQLREAVSRWQRVELT